MLYGGKVCLHSGGRTMRDSFVKVNGCTAQMPPEPGTTWNPAEAWKFFTQV